MTDNELEKKANQWIFTQAWNHIIKQGCPSYIEETDECFYRMTHPEDPGREISCAFAPAIREYKASMERLSAHNLLEDFNNMLHPEAQQADIEFCNETQWCHDSTAANYDPKDFISQFKKAMRELAREYDLKVPTDIDNCR